MELKPARPKSQQQELRFEMSDWGQKQQDHPSGIESANKFLRTKLQMLQQDFDNVLADRNSKESKIQQLDESLKNAEDEKKKMNKTLQNLQNQLEKLRKTNEELKKSNSEAESELLMMKKVLSFFS
jgi:predicted nuclease with TOPRIM domain